MSGLAEEVKRLERGQEGAFGGNEKVALEPGQWLVRPSVCQKSQVSNSMNNFWHLLFVKKYLYAVVLWFPLLFLFACFLM